MLLPSIYTNYIRIKYQQQPPDSSSSELAYFACEDGSCELFFAGYEESTFREWAYEIQPPDPHYTANPDRQPILAASFPRLDVYEEMVLYYLLFTMNTTLSIVPVHAYNRMNDFMKSYCFLQLSHIEQITRLGDTQREGLRDFLFWFYLYSHPVNGETLESFSFCGQDLIYTETGIMVEDYMERYHAYYIEHHAVYRDQLAISPGEIKSAGQLTMELLHTIEGKTTGLQLPAEDGLEEALSWIHHVDGWFGSAEELTAVFEVMSKLATTADSAPYHDHCLRILLQNHVCYVLYFDFSRVLELLDYFRDHAAGKIIINRMFSDTIFAQKIVRQKGVNLYAYPELLEYWEEKTRSIYL